MLRRFAVEYVTKNLSNTFWTLFDVSDCCFLNVQKNIGRLIWNIDKFTKIHHKFWWYIIILSCENVSMRVNVSITIFFSSSLALSVPDVGDYHSYPHFIGSTSKEHCGANTKPFVDVNQPWNSSSTQASSAFYLALYDIL